MGTLKGLPVLYRRRGGRTASRNGLYVQGYTRPTMAGTKAREAAMTGTSRKAGLSPDWSLQLGPRKLEWIVIVDQHGTVNTFPGLVHTGLHHT